ncbi:MULTISPECIES: alpha/beta fold hydrolase [unclassified Streptomyces]|uniref:alpha/beta fold hydrolase n=1 Tax=unclassified Streptomyces TaxID=2593676 RepID=UPI0023669673|nr:MULTISPECIES: alpha/beta fold hydrolase [unclassified Streptomyces]MDF3139853.1 alpha/beta fold hydrolase [Streptomyces sp. T21Q-yed]WDF41911.1 alpha/beta fold hydrolase [Streptomyces sp. T12]
MHYLLLAEHQARVRWVDVPGVRPARVYVHGLGSAAVDFFSLAAHPLLAGHRTILVDLLGFGFSDRPESFGYTVDDHAEVVERVLDELHLSDCEVVAHSMGGAVTVALARKRPDLVSRLVLAEPCLTGGGKLSGRIATLSEHDYVRRGHAMIAARLGNSRNVTDLEALPAFQAASPLAVHRSAVGLVRGTREDLRHVLQELPLPRAYLVGEHSLPDLAAETLRASGVAVLIVRGAGHMMMHDAPQTFAESVHRAISSA